MPHMLRHRRIPAVGMGTPQMSVRDITPARRQALRRARGDGYVDGSTGASFGHRRPHAADEAEQASYETGWHIGRYEKLDIPVPAHISTVDAEDYARALYCEETGESLTVMGSGGRFGLDMPGRDGGDSPRHQLAREMGDVLAAIEYGCRTGLVDRALVDSAMERKLARLISPASRDNQGRRLAPPPYGYDVEPEDRLVDMTNVVGFEGFAGQAMLLGRRIVRYEPRLAMEHPGNVFAGWMLDDHDTWVVLAHPCAGRVIAVDDGRPGRGMILLDHEIVSVTLRKEDFQIVTVGPGGVDDTVTWRLDADAALGPGDNLRHGLVLMHRPPRHRGR